MRFFFYENHEGLMSDNGETEHNDFCWSLDGNILTIRPHYSETMNLTVTELTASTLSLRGSITLDEQWVELVGTWEKVR